MKKTHDQSHRAETAANRAEKYIAKIQQDNVALGMRKASDQEYSRAVKKATEVALKVIQGKTKDGDLA